MWEHVLIKHKGSNQGILSVLSVRYLAVIKKKLLANVFSFLQADPI